jgi:transposase-like protein
MVFGHTPEHASQWAAIRSVGDKLGIRTESLRRWVRQAERDAGQRPGLTTTERDEFKHVSASAVRRTAPRSAVVRAIAMSWPNISG